MNWFRIILLAIIQGLTEFLPVSSSGHLVVANALLTEPLPDLIEVSIFLHLGTLLAVLVFYHQRVLRLLGHDRRVIVLLVIGTLPAVVVGLPLKKLAPGLLESPLLAGLLFPATAALLIGASRRLPGEADYADLTWKNALLIGAFQAVAILPGISRSGATIAAGLFSGLKRDSAAAFAFLLAIPAICGAVTLELLDIAQQSTTTGPWLLAAGTLLSFVVGLASLWCLTAIVNRGRIFLFAWWLIPLGIAVTVWQAALLLSGQ